MDFTLSTHLVFYVHGLPGSPAELDYFLPEPLHQAFVLPPDRLDEFDRIMKLTKAKTASLIGFSLGAKTAIEIACERAEIVTDLALISPAGPLSLGDYLPSMAGKVVFHTAMKSSVLFRLLTTCQGGLVRFAPNFLIRTMFANSPQAEKEFLKNEAFMTMLKEGLHSSLCGNTAPYRNAVQSYVQPWQHKLSSVQCPVKIWHGSKDDWAPLDISKDMAKILGDKATLNICEGLGHYSTLKQALLKTLGK